MPFTLSHPAAITPLSRWTSHPFCIVALVIGSMVPDLGYYLRMFSFATFAHSFSGSFIVCVPAGMLLLACLLIAREPLLWLMPSRIQGILRPAFALPSKGAWKLFFEVCLWIWVGSLTHILWDSFTHKTGWFVQRSSALQSSLILGDGHSFPAYYILQQASTVIGLCIVACIAWRVCRRSAPGNGCRRGDLLRYGFWLGLVAISIGSAAPFAMSQASHHEGLLRFRTFIFQLGTLSGSIFGALAMASVAIAACRTAVIRLAATIVLLIATPGLAQAADYPKAKVSFEDFKALVAEVEPHRAERLIDLDTFLKMSREPGVIILDSRSAFRYDRIHVKGAKHLAFTDFTQANLAKVIPSFDTTILIYCNNNFEGNPVDFATKMVAPNLPAAPLEPRGATGNRSTARQFAVQAKPLMMALNVPTYINLYGYGYRNVYELNELVDVTDPRIAFEGTIVPPGAPAPVEKPPTAGEGRAE
ncbi:MAG: DUF4184 family protein [Chthoniobacterales bacterium]|nr:DUF4184 family protein [Chthoniobacterales bacterium]